MSRRKKGGNFMNDSMQTYNNNKQYIEPVYDATAAIGIASTIFGTVMATIIAIILIVVGYNIKNIDSEKTSVATGTITKADCTPKNKTCVADIKYTVDKVDYSVQTTTGLVNKNQTIQVNYDPSNANNFTIYSYYPYIGWGIITVAIIMLISSWGWLLMTLLFKPLAAASGVGAVASTIMPDYGNNNYGNGNNYGNDYGNNYGNGNGY
jgi:hypothetical protein